MSMTRISSTHSSSGKLNLESPSLSDADDITASYTKNNKSNLHPHHNNEHIRNYLKNYNAVSDISPTNSTSSSSNSPAIVSDAKLEPRNQQQYLEEIQEKPIIPPKLTKLPRDYKLCPIDDLLVLVSRMLESLILINDKQTNKLSNENLTRFHSRIPPPISVHSYLSRLIKFSNIENSILLSAIYYIDLLSNSYPSFILNSLTVHRFLLTATTIGSKGLCDSFCTSSHYAKVGGVNIHELNLLEMDFLQKVNWRIVPQLMNYQRRRSSATGINPVIAENYISICKANEVLDMYYRNLVSIVGEKIEINDSIYVLEDEQQSQPSDPTPSYKQSVSSSSSTASMASKKRTSELDSPNIKRSSR